MLPAVLAGCAVRGAVGGGVRVGRVLCCRLCCAWCGRGSRACGAGAVLPAMHGVVGPGAVARPTVRHSHELGGWVGESEEEPLACVLVQRGGMALG